MTKMMVQKFFEDMIKTGNDGHDFLPLLDVLRHKSIDPTSRDQVRNWIDGVLDAIISDYSTEHQECWRNNSNEILDLAADYCVVDAEALASLGYYRIDTVRGIFIGTAEQCAAWLVEYQPAYVFSLPDAVGELLVDNDQGFSLA